MQRALKFLTLLLLAFLAFDCVYAFRVPSQPTVVKLRVQGPEAPQHSVRVALKQSAYYEVAADGKVAFTAPSFRNGCHVYLFGVVKTRDGSAERVRRFSLAQISKLRIDEGGYSVVRIGN